MTFSYYMYVIIIALLTQSDGIINANQSLGINPTNADLLVLQEGALDQHSVETEEQSENSSKEEDTDPTIMLAIFGIIALSQRKGLGKMYGVFGQFAAVFMGVWALIAGVTAAFSEGMVIYGIATILIAIAVVALPIWFSFLENKK